MPSDKITHLFEHDPKDTSPSSAPSLAQPVQHSHNPYDFIMNPSAPPKKRLLPTGNSKTSRIAVAAAGGAVLLVIVFLVMSLLNSGSANLKADYLSLAQQQADLIKIADMGVAKSKTQEAKYLASTTKYTMLSAQPATQAAAKKAGVKINSKSLSKGHDSQTEKKLNEASQANRFDEVFIGTLREKLKNYQAKLTEIYNATKSKSQREALSKDYADVQKLIGPQQASGLTQ